MSRLEFLRARGQNQKKKAMPLSLVPHRWSSESNLDVSETVSSLTDFSAGLKTLPSRNRLSFSDLIKRKTCKAEDAKPHSHTSGILDMLKRKFKGNFKIAKSERSCFKEMTKHRSLSVSVSSVEENPPSNLHHQKSNLPLSQVLPSVEEPCQQCQFSSRTRNCCDAQENASIPSPELNQVKCITQTTAFLKACYLP